MNRRLAAAFVPVLLVATGCTPPPQERSAEVAQATYGPVLQKAVEALSGVAGAPDWAPTITRPLLDGGRCHTLLARTAPQGGTPDPAAVRRVVDGQLAPLGFRPLPEGHERQGLRVMETGDATGVRATVWTGRELKVELRVPAPRVDCG